MNRPFKYLIGSLGLIALNSCEASNATQAGQPNVIYIFPDQFRNHALEFWGDESFREQVNFTPDPVRTPRLNQFARESVVLSSAQSNCPLSSPHRGMLFTGMYANKSGVPLNCNSSRPISSLREDAICMSDVFSEAGYDCAYFGKLHLDFPTPNDPQRPGRYVEDRVPAWDAYTPPGRRHGFNYWYSYGTFDEHKNPHYWDTDGQRHDPQEWSPKHETDKVVAYLRNEGNVRDKSKPFFMMIAMNPPHSPYRSLEDCMEEDYLLYKDTSFDNLLIRPNADPNMEKAQCAPYYFASITGVDREFGRILDTLHDMGLDENTIVIFSSDHGETMTSQRTDDPKNSPYAESMNVPFIVRYPGQLTPGVDDLLISTPDVMPTVLGLSGLEAQIPGDVQGYNYAPLFFDKDASVTRPQGALYLQNLNGDIDTEGMVQNYFPVSRGIKTHQYTLALYIDKNTKQLTHSVLFDDVNDPYQLNNLPLEENIDIVRELCAEMGKQLNRIEDPWALEKILENQYGIIYN